MGTSPEVSLSDVLNCDPSPDLWHHKFTHHGRTSLVQPNIEMSPPPSLPGQEEECTWKRSSKFITEKCYSSEEFSKIKNSKLVLNKFKTTSHQKNLFSKYLPGNDCNPDSELS